MDPSIMKLLDDDEDETIHSGADVEAFTAALNRDIKGETSTSQPLDSASGGMAQGNNPTSSQLFAQWQNSIKSEENVPSQNQQEGLKNLQPQEQVQQQQRSSETDSAQRQSGSDSHQQQSSCSVEHSHLQQSNSSMEQTQQPVQQNQFHDNQLQRQVEHNAPQFSQKNAVQTSEQNTAHIPEQQDRMRYPDQQSFPKMQKMNNQPAPTAEQSNNPMNRNKQVPFGLLLPAILPHLDKDRAMQLQTLFAKLRTNEINKDGFVRLMRSIVGDKMLRLAVNTIQTQEMAKEQAARNSQTGPHQFQKGLRAPADPSQVSSSTAQLQADSSFPTKENNPQKSKETEHQSDSQGMNVNQMSSTSMSTVKQEREVPAVPLRGLNKQQQHLHFSQTPFSMYGSNMSNYHPHGYSAPPVSAGLASLKPQTQDSQMRQVPHHHGVGSTQAPGASQPMNVMNPSRYEIQTSTTEPKRFHGGHPTLQNNAAQWQPMNKEQKSNALSSMACVKQEVVDQTPEQQQKSQFSASLSPCSFGAVQLEQGNIASPGTSKDEMMEKQSSRNPFSTSTPSVQSNSVSVSVPTQGDSMMTVPSTTTPLGAGTIGKTLPKKPSIGQKKPLDALGTPSPVASKKQKVSGAFLDQSIEQLNDVTAVSGVNLREEEEQLLSGPKEESRASEATRRVVQEEEERLLLQKIPLQKKLAKIMSKCGLKNISNDVERCLSLCVEERMRGLISNLIRLSKQRVDIERPRHRTIITSDVRRQILLMNRKAKEDWEKKQAEEAEKLRKLNEAEGNGGTDGEKDKDEGRSKALKANKEEDDKMRTTAANVAARVAVGGDDMLSKWQLMAEQARQKREGGSDVASAAESKDASHRSLSSSRRILRDNQGAESRGSSAAASGAMRKFGRDSVMQHTKIARSVSVKDVIAVLEREPQMSKSTMIYRLYDKMPADSATE